MDEDETPPDLKVASSKTQEEIDRDRRLSEVGWATRAFAANLLRVMRGAGKDYFLTGQLFDLANAMKECVNAGEHYVAVEKMTETLRSAMPDVWIGRERNEPYATIAAGSLQLLASKLLGQSTQERRGESEITDGIKEMEEFWARMREKFRAEFTPLPIKPVRRAARKIATKPAPKAPPKQRAAAPLPPPVAEPDEKPKSTAEFMRRNQQKVTE